MPNKLRDIPEIKFCWRHDLMAFELLDIFYPELTAHEIVDLILGANAPMGGSGSFLPFAGFDEPDPHDILETFATTPNYDMSEWYLSSCAKDGRAAPYSFSALAKDQFFDQPEAMADFDFWATIPYWTPDEAVSLSFGRSPEVVTAKRLSRFIYGESKFATEFFQRKERIFRAVSADILPEQIRPEGFVGWLKSAKMDIPEELLVALETHSTQRRGEADAVQEAPKEKERDSLLKLILGMSVDRYGYRVGEKRNSATGDKGNSIAARLESLGIRLDSDTIRKYLKEAEDRFGDLVDEPDR